MRKGIFCLEGLWYPKALHRGLSVRPILEMLELRERVPFVCRDCGTCADLSFYLQQFPLKRYEHFPILYLAFHGCPNRVIVGNESMTLDSLAAKLNGGCKRKVIVFGTCSTLRMNKRTLKSFLDRTGALAVCGYQGEVDWIPSTAFELMVLFLIVKSPLTREGLVKVKERTERIGRSFQELQYRMVTRYE